MHGVNGLIDKIIDLPNTYAQRMNDNHVLASFHIFSRISVIYISIEKGKQDEYEKNGEIRHLAL